MLHRAAGSARYPARFQLVMAANPCPCGRAVGKGLDCTCTPLARRRYFSRLSGPLLDRVDLQVEVLPVTRAGAPAGRGAHRRVAGRVAGRGLAGGAPVRRDRLADQRRGPGAVAAWAGRAAGPGVLETGGGRRGA